MKTKKPDYTKYKTVLPSIKDPRIIEHPYTTPKTMRLAIRLGLNQPKGRGGRMFIIERNVRDFLAQRFQAHQALPENYRTEHEAECEKAVRRVLKLLWDEIFPLPAEELAQKLGLALEMAQDNEL